MLSFRRPHHRRRCFRKVREVLMTSQMECRVRHLLTVALMGESTTKKKTDNVGLFFIFES